MRNPASDKNRQNRTRRPLRLWSPALAAGLGFLWASPVLAQHVARSPEPEKPVFQWLFALAMTGLCAGLAAWNAKRSHLD